MSELPHRFGGLNAATDDPDQAIDDRLDAQKALDIATAWLKAEGYTNVETILVVNANVPSTGEGRTFALGDGHSEQIMPVEGDEEALKLVMLRMIGQLAEVQDRITMSLLRTFGDTLTETDLKNAIPPRKD